MTAPTPPNVLTAIGAPLIRKVLDKLATDTDPAAGLMPALGQRTGADGTTSGANSLYPNYNTDGPDARREVCPAPFIIAYDGGKRSIDKRMRELRVILELHDDRDAGVIRLPGLLDRVLTVLVLSGWMPPGDAAHQFTGGLYFEQQGPAYSPIADDRYTTNVVQVVLCCKAVDRTSGRGYGG